MRPTGAESIDMLRAHSDKGEEFNSFLSEGKALANGVLEARTEKQSHKIFRVISLSSFMPKNYKLCHLLGEGS